MPWYLLLLLCWLRVDCVLLSVLTVLAALTVQTEQIVQTVQTVQTCKLRLTVLTVLMTVLSWRLRYFVGIVECAVDCADCGFVVLLSVLIMLIVLNYDVALNVLAVNVAFVVGLLSSLFSMFFIMWIALWNVLIVLFCGAWLRVLFRLSSLFILSCIKEWVCAWSTAVYLHKYAAGCLDLQLKSKNSSKANVF